MEHKSCKLSYDRKYDILYARISSEPSYGDDSRDDGIVVMRSIASNEITGEMVFNIKGRLKAGAIHLDKLPVPLDPQRDEIVKLLEPQTA